MADAHDPEGVGAACLEMSDFDGPTAFLAALRQASVAGEYRPHAIRYARRPAPRSSDRGPAGRSMDSRTARVGTPPNMDDDEALFEPPQVPPGGGEWDLDNLEIEAERTSDVAWLKAAVGGLAAAVREHVPAAESPVIYVNEGGPS